MREKKFLSTIQICILLPVTLISGLAFAQQLSSAPDAADTDTADNATPSTDANADADAAPDDSTAAAETATETSTAPEESAQPVAAPMPSPAPEKRWYVTLNGTSAGPFNEAEMHTKIQQGVIQSNTQIAEVGTSQWVPASSQFSNFPQQTIPVAVSTVSPSDPRPSSGIGAMVTGSIMLGVGAVNLITIPVCYMDGYSEESQDLCVGLSAGVGGTLVAVGLPLLIAGVVKRKRFKAWRSRNAALMNFTLSANNHFGGLAWNYQF